MSCAHVLSNKEEPIIEEALEIGSQTRMRELSLLPKWRANIDPKFIRNLNKI